eukprot:TRINITY_DN28694_c0_g1_i1.p1 TRINITY_DN28694_c0_g1~~TRINITY_DN28694_c0_g1_i1.p1  ORF type:complete len:1733 (+),score=650.46 TRINITY_DN28694_c0_g1_i1:97-5295(+)
MAKRLRERAGSQLADSFAFRPAPPPAPAAAGVPQDAPVNRCLVYCRLRPAKTGEINEKDGSYELLKLGGKQVRVDEDKFYDYDGTFGGQSTQGEIFDGVGRPNVDHVFRGFCSAIMCYGQTGTGKSFTMCNNKPGQEGIIPRAAQHIYRRISEDPSRKYKVVGQFVQIYRDALGDLMDPLGGKVDLRYDEKQGVTLPGCTETELATVEDFMALYEEGNSRRVVTATKMNPESSRGHTALVVWIISEPVGDDEGGTIRGKITFIDLAGYERFSKTGVGGDPVMKDEAKTINASLLALGHVVSALSQGEKHIPWRNAKLTRLLQDSIGGNSRTSIMLTVGPSSEHLHESTNTLQFGARAMAVKVSAKRSENVDYQKLAAKLQHMLAEKEDRINVLELAATSHQMELEAVKERHARDTEVLRERQRVGLNKLLEEGASKEQLERLIKQNEVEEQDLVEQHQLEIDNTQETFQTENRRILGEMEDGHRQLAADLKQKVAALELQLVGRDKQLQAAVDTIHALMEEKGEPVSREALVAEVLASSADGTDAGEITAVCAAQAGGADAEELRKVKEELAAVERELRHVREEEQHLRTEIDSTRQAADDKVGKMKKSYSALTVMVKKLKEDAKGAEERGQMAAANAAKTAEQSAKEIEAARKEHAADTAALDAKLRQALRTVDVYANQLEQVSAEASAKAAAMRSELEAETAKTVAQLESEREHWAGERDRLEGARKSAETERADMLVLVERAVDRATDERKRVEETLEQMEALEVERERLEQAVLQSRLQQEAEAADRERERKLMEQTLRDAERVRMDASARQKAEAEAQAAELRRAAEEEAALRRRAEVAQKEAAQRHQVALEDLTQKLRFALEESEKAKADVEICSTRAMKSAAEEQEKLKEEYEAREAQLRARAADSERLLSIYTDQLKQASDDAAARADALRKQHEEESAATHAKLEAERAERQAERLRHEHDRKADAEALRAAQEGAKRTSEAAARKKEIAERLVDEAKELTRAKLDSAQSALDAQRAELKRLKQALADAECAKGDALVGKERHKSQMIADLVHAGRMRPPRDAPPLLQDAEQYEAELSCDEVRHFFRCSVVVLGDSATGKTSVSHCITSMEPKVFKSLPQVSPTLQWERHTVAEGATQKSLRGSSKVPHAVHFEVWDTPCDISSVSHIPPASLPCSRAVYLVTVPLDLLGSETGEGMMEWERSVRPRLESQLRAVRAASSGRLPKGVKIPVVLCGTRRDLLPASSRGAADALSLLEMPVAWLRQVQEEQHVFHLESAFAVSCKDWSVLPAHAAELGLPDSVGFPGLLSHLAAVCRRRFPLVPSAILEGNAEATVQDLAERPDQLEAWLASQPSTRDAALNSQMGLLTLAMHVQRLRGWNRWNIGGGEWAALLASHLRQPPDLLPARAQQVTAALAAAGLVIDFQDPATGERVIVIEPQLVARMISSASAPHIFLTQTGGGEPASPIGSPGRRLGTQLAVFGARDAASAHLTAKRALAAEGFSVDQLTTAQWQQCYNGVVTADSAKVVFGRCVAYFGGSTALLMGFLSALGGAFVLKTEQEPAWFVPCMAVTRLTPMAEAWLRRRLGDGYKSTAFVSSRPFPLARYHSAAGHLYSKYGVSWCAKRDAVILRAKDGSWGYVQWRPRCLIAVGKAEGGFESLLGELREFLPETEEAPADKMLRPVPELSAQLAASCAGPIEGGWAAISTGGLPDEASPFPDWRAIR